MFTQQQQLLARIAEVKRHVRRPDDPTLYFLVRQLVSYDDRTPELIEDLKREPPERKSLCATR